jgi:uncharacterized protein YebE (UPF0316 family)
MNRLIVSLISSLTGYITAINSTTRLPDIGLDWGSIPSTIVPWLIFCLRTTNLVIATLRMLTVIRGHRTTVWFLGMVQAGFFITTIAGVLGTLYNPWNLIAYAAGLATGNVLGMMIEAKLAPGHSLLRITSSTRGTAVLDILHRHGYGATEASGQGRTGMVSVILCYVPRRQVEQAKQHVISADPEAFITIDYVRQLRGGWGT